MISSCQECETNCCQAGPGPHIPIPVITFLRSYGLVWNYNTKCEHLTEKGKCAVWGDDAPPAECRFFVCNIRSYTLKELEQIHIETENEDQEEE